jgi:GH15 family glucan-1,4-alpha-glucosidase
VSKHPRDPYVPDTYKPISDYGVIGNLTTTALVGCDGSIDWCCLPHLDSPSVFGAILDHERGGRFKIAPVGKFGVEQKYLHETNVLETRFTVDGGCISVVDFMPIAGSIIGVDAPETRPEIQRLIRCEWGTVELEIEWSPRFGYSENPTRIEPADGGWIARLGSEWASLGCFKTEDDPDRSTSGDRAIEHGRFGDTVRVRRKLSSGQPLALVMRFGEVETAHSPEACHQALGDSVETWRAWVRVETADREWAKKFKPQVIRSELVLKLLTRPSTGAIAAAATTSLPEVIGGIRNWDYRFTWIRDSAFTVQALLAVGHRAEALDFLGFVERAAMSNSEQGFGLQIMYGMSGETDLSERDLPFLSGYRDSRPVRIGNAAAKQQQHDIYGELMGAAYQFIVAGGTLDADLLKFLARVADAAAEVWRSPDQGIWEARHSPRHYVYSKVMVWVALDRAIQMMRRTEMRGDLARWTRERDAVHAAVLEHGFNKELNSFVQSFGSEAPDAANLLIPVLEFLPFDDPRVQGTIEHTRKTLMRDGMMYRYLTDDGLPGSEGAFGLCTYWMVHALALSGRIDEATELFESMDKRANHLGLYSEEIDPRSGAFLGNFPQAFTHIGLINGAIYLARAEGRRAPQAPQPIGARSETESSPSKGAG